ncbi:MerR family transcriptional regulator [Kaistia adipata]|uniref:MerR family transcriptional regulator n=1 Tax=Kaistia adipata TaxID=166954 RepID=UPI0003FD3451|nr:MerR family transcriptional regulator [Kaistia adipata]
MSKGPDAFRTISEVAEELDLPQHVLRFWETRFTQIKPMKRGGGRRYYRPDDVDLLRGIRRLLYGEGYTIKGVQRILKEQGARHVIGAGQGIGLDPAPEGDELEDYGDDILQDPGYDPPDTGEDFDEPPHGEIGMGGRREPSFSVPADLSDDGLEASVRAAVERQPRHYPDGRVDPPNGPSRIPVAPPDLETSAEDYRPRSEAAPARSWQPPAATPHFQHDVEPEGGPSGFAPAAQPRQPADPGRPSPHERGGQVLSGSDREQLRATLMELLECKRILDNVR